MNLPSKYPFYLANKPVSSEVDLAVTNKYTGKTVSQISMANAAHIEDAIAAAVNAQKPLAQLASFERKAILKHCVQRFQERKKEFIELLCIEAGKPFKDSEREVNRLISTFEIAAEESTRRYGEIIPLDIVEGSKGYEGFWKRFPIGPALFISPFNFPLNLPAHKIAPAIAVGCPFILKPSLLTPISALIIGEILAETNLPAGSFSILPCENTIAETMVGDSRLKLLSFTGSADVGWHLKSKSGKMKVVLELGGNAACIVDSGEEKNLQRIVDRLIFGAYYQSGQSCISVQRIFIHHSLYDKVKDLMIEKIKTLKMGDPLDPNTFIGPMISEKEANKVNSFIQSALKNGAKCLIGGKRNGVMIEPTLVENVPISEKLYTEEAFGPVALLQPFTDFDSVLEEVNNSRYGLQAGLFTNQYNHIHKAWNTLEVGGIVINDIPSWRGDNMPYGGVKDSGMSREGVCFAMEDLTEIRMLTVYHSS